MIALQPGYSGREMLALLESGYEYYIGKPKQPEHTVIGSVEWCQAQLPAPVQPDYYPAKLTPWLYREVWTADKWPLGKRVFIKPADAYKRFTGFVTNGGYKKKRRGPYACSTIVQFIDEWRYYVADGVVLSAGWYDGEHELADPPDLPEGLPLIFGAYDFGTLATGELALVEWQHPFACGWYGPREDHKKYIDWLIAGWHWMLSEAR